jgi:hypothetical protein
MRRPWYQRHPETYADQHCPVCALCEVGRYEEEVICLDENVHELCDEHRKESDDDNEEWECG